MGCRMKTKAYNDGWFAYTMGKSINSCPHIDLDDRKEWTQGWIDVFFIEEEGNPLDSGNKREIK